MTLGLTLDILYAVLIICSIIYTSYIKKNYRSDFSANQSNTHINIMYIRSLQSLTKAEYAIKHAVTQLSKLKLKYVNLFC